MSEPSHFYPHYITEILAYLESNEFADKILAEYYNKTLTDPVLFKIFSKLNYPEASQIACSVVKSLITNEYMPDFPPIDADPEIKPSETLEFVHENSVDLLKEDLFDSSHLSGTGRKEADKVCCKVSGRSRNGLKVLSSKVKDVVESLGCSTYQEVADFLVNDNDWVGKDEKNARRRIYDALNVLIAVGALRRENKKVKGVRKAAEGRTEKLGKLKEVSERYLKVKGLIERNKINKSCFQNLYLPFEIIAVSKGSNAPVKILTSIHKSTAIIKLDQRFKIIHSDEVLKVMNIEYDLSWLPEGVDSIILKSRTQKLS